MTLVIQVFLFALLGMALYGLDRNYGASIYRWWYDMTHRDPLPAHQRRSFVIGRSQKERLFAAAQLSLLIALISLASGSLWRDPAGVLVQLLCVWAGLSLGLALAPPWLSKWFSTPARSEIPQDPDVLAQDLPAAEADNTAAPFPSERSTPKAAQDVDKHPDQESPGTADPKTNTRDTDQDPEDWRKGVEKFLKK